MKPITDEDLTLLFYGEHEDPGLAARVAESPELTARFDTLVAELACLDTISPPQRGDNYGAEVWQKISPQLTAGKKQPGRRRAGWLSGLLQPRFSLAGALSLALVAVLAFTLGRQGGQMAEVPLNGPVTSQAGLYNDRNSARLLATSVSGHLEQLNLELTQFANMTDGYTPQAERATELLVANRLYRQTAAARGNKQLASFLAELEPLLVELAYEAYNKSPQTHVRLQSEVKNRLLFRVRAMHQQLGQPDIST